MSAVVLGPLVLAAVWIGGWTFHIMIALVAVLAVAEWIGLVPQDRRVPALVVAAAGVLAAIVAQIALGPVLAVVLALAAAVALSIAGGGREQRLLGFGATYVALGGIGLVWLRDLPDDGLALLLFAMLAVWATDIGAYAAGRSIGGPKLAPRISPKKTWAGLIGGMVSAALVGWAVALAFGAEMPALALLAGAVVAVVSQVGDLFESAVKRRFDAKDSGRLIPGHGGILDRIDGLLVAAPVVAVFHATVGTALAWW
nr:phosphatidate cytidylyltransferase [Azospirillum sp. SYSU D00513]